MIEKNRLKIAKIIITCVIIAAVCNSISVILGNGQLENENNGLSDCMAEFFDKQLKEQYFMLPVFLENGEDEVLFAGRIRQMFFDVIPVYAYVENWGQEKKTEDDLMAENFRQKEGSDEDRKEIDEEKLDYGKDALHIENSMMAEMQKENEHFKEQIQIKGTNINGEKQQGNGKQNDGNEQEQSVATEIDFLPAEYPAYTYDWGEQWGYEELVSNFYAIDATTSLKEEYMNLEKLLYTDLTVDIDTEGPQILIYHTHSQEDFVDSVEGDASTTIVGAGAKLAEILTEEYGFNVMHHTGEYDVESRDDAYANSLPAIEKILEENPSIEVVIDVHRDEMQEGKKLVMDLQGRPTARFMFFDGMSYIRDKGEISYLENPYIQQNLTFSFQAQVAANEYYPGIARRIYLKAYRYNLHLCPKSILIELGAQTNTVEEIMNACDPLAHTLAIVLKD